MKKQTIELFNFTLTLALTGLAPIAQARVVRVDITRVESPTFEGTVFGKVGQYEKMVGVAYMEVDPLDPHNADIVNLERAPRNKRGMVDYNADIYILKPIDMERGNHKLFLEVHNRGNKLALNFLNDSPGGVNDPTTATDAGNGFLFREGYTVLWTGWQGDVTPDNDRMTIRVPVATQKDGSPIVARVRQEYSDRFIPTDGTFTLPLSGITQFASYESATMDTSQAVLTARERTADPRSLIPADQWAFATCTPNEDGTLDVQPSPFDICLFEGFRVDRLYELTYPAKNPLVMGLGYAVTRDVISFLRYEYADDAGNPNPVGSGITNVYGLGISSSGMYMRDWLYLGFNEDEQGRKVFDGAWSHIGGGHRLLMNVEFAQPNDYSRQDIWHDFISNSIFPFGYSVTTDPITGRTDGILKRPTTDPLLIVTDTSTEFWEFRGSLVTHDAFGNEIPVPSNARSYVMSSLQHSVGPGGPPTRGSCQQLSNPLANSPIYRALLTDLDDWVTRGINPPENRYPRGRDLVPPDRDSTGFPQIPGVTYTGLLNELHVWDYGLEFGPAGGRMTLLPPLSVPNTDYTLLVPRVDAIGNDAPGVRSTFIEAPIATYTGWNVRAAGFREGELCGLTGSYIALARTQGEREQAGDPRPSLEELYGDHAGYVRAVARAAIGLWSQRFLLWEDVRRLITEAQNSDVLR
jgi:hypothetical protein